MASNEPGFSKARVETFSDGIFAIIVTLLVLEIKAPHIAAPATTEILAAQLLHLAPKLASWLISFFTVCVIWVNHHRIFSSIEQVTHGIFWANALLLAIVSFIPFPTAVLGDYPQSALAASLYGAVMALMSLGFYLMRRALLANPGRQPKLDVAAFRRATHKALWFSLAPYIIAIGLAWVSPLASMAVYFATAIYFMVPARKPHAR